METSAFKAAVEAAIISTGLSATKFGRLAVADPGFVFGLRNGRSPTLNTVEKVITFIKANDPEPHP